ncbi:1,2-phenylacetyl-CoA epoxidase subunit PaaD [Sporosarcina limicola]|uniref:Ring-1,2-phenylacetyl-CoA epoxidase subunit PaaD n=1 Tax=Sporosarcina limicola TaxID=34101 RepID=A0A927MLW3_9BACL|nr:1,2-phenylacetyl-CoA epoxidase subunit PaaD [Sporosarcina limicola]MBE1555312.1 ring-1,2-phenylacetyl-CoA epoxidase subunit PaaD [Sporosarcina limicola]
MVTTTDLKNDTVLQVLWNVKDPEIDTVSIVDLGMVEKIEAENNHVTVTLLPTFLGCPALEIIRENTRKAVQGIPGVAEVTVDFIYSPPWTSDRVTEQGRAGLKEFGIAAPPRHLEEDGSWHVDCPYCDSTYVTMENIFGPTACRSILYCRSCKTPFEAMKPVSTLM